MGSVFFHRGRLYRFVVPEQPEYSFPPGSEIRISLDSMGCKANMMIENPRTGLSMSYDDCDIHGPLISWIKGKRVIAAAMYRYQRGGLKLVGVFHDASVNPREKEVCKSCGSRPPIEEWVAEDKGGIDDEDHADPECEC